MNLEAPSAQIPALARVKTKIFADGADAAAMVALRSSPMIAGFTTNPTLMHKSGVRDYASFAREVLRAIPDLPISFEVIADDETEMERQAHAIASWGENVYVKIPVTETNRSSTSALVHRLSHAGVKVNVTAILTLEQVRATVAALAGGAPSNVSIFAGRIADTGRDPMPVVRAAVAMAAAEPQIELIWASPRELLNLFHADACGAHIITMTNDLLAKLRLVGRDLADYSLDTVKMFFNDARAAQLEL